MIVVWLFLTMPWVCLQYVIVVFPDHTHLLFLLQNKNTEFNFEQETESIIGVIIGSIRPL